MGFTTKLNDHAHYDSLEIPNERFFLNRNYFFLNKSHKQSLTVLQSQRLYFV